MDDPARGESLLFEIGEHPVVESLRFGEIGVRHVVGELGVALADVPGGQADGDRAGVAEVRAPVHHLVHVQGVVFDVGRDAPRPAVG